MSTIEIRPDCGNSPRKLFLAGLNTAFAKGDVSFINNNIPENISWEVAGQTKITGKENFIAELKKAPICKGRRLKRNTIITHGPDASVSGEIVTNDNSKFLFCDIYRFKGSGGTTINSILTFMIRL